MSESGRIVIRGNLVYLQVSGHWYYYDTTSRCVGSGAMGTVYLGHKYKSQEIVAIKKVNDHYAGIKQIRERARLEASLMFRHKNLVEMVGICELSPTSGPIYLVSHFVNGVTLDSYISNAVKGKDNAVRKTCELMYPVLDALEYLHSKNIVHLDVKPSNIMMEMGRNVRLMDLGIAFTSGMNSGGFGLIGTPKYAAPEQVSKNGQRTIDKTTDIYQAGVTLYELLTGNNPFDAETRDEIISRHSTLMLPPDTNVPSSLLKVLRKATSIIQSDRYQSAQELKSSIIDCVSEDGTGFVKTFTNFFKH